MSTKYPVMMFSLAAGLLQGCGDPDDDAIEDRQGLVVHSDMQYSDDVRYFKYTVAQVDCASSSAISSGASEQVTIGPDALYLPNGLPAFESKPLAPESAHIFGDHFFVLPSGCYDVESQPLDDQQKPSKSCYSAHASKVKVVDGLTTEILLISQCLGPGRGGLDAATALNHPPTIEDLVFEPSKFVSTCNGVEICATAIDPDNDPMTFVWEQTSGNQVARGPNVARTTLSGGFLTQCVVVQTGALGDYEFKVTVFDMAYDEDGELVRMEDILAAQGDAHASHDDLTVPVHAGVDCPITGRTAVMVMTLHGPQGMTLSPADAKILTKNVVDYVNPNGAGNPAKILLVHDYNNHDEDNDDPDEIAADLKALYGSGNVVVKDPCTVLKPADVEGYDIVWFSNPGWPMGNASSMPTTFNTLINFRGTGGGLVLQGDDITQSSTGTLMESLTYLKFSNNGTSACGQTIDGWGPGAYKVSFANDTTHPLLLGGLAGKSFDYHNDLDHSVALGLGESVVAFGDVSTGNCPLMTPALVAIDPAMLTATIP